MQIKVIIIVYLVDKSSLYYIVFIVDKLYVIYIFFLNIIFLKILFNMLKINETFIINQNKII